MVKCWVTITRETSRRFKGPQSPARIFHHWIVKTGKSSTERRYYISSLCTKKCAVAHKNGTLVYKGPATPKSKSYDMDRDCECGLAPRGGRPRKIMETA